jgi:hypothetical protein
VKEFRRKVDRAIHAVDDDDLRDQLEDEQGASLSTIIDHLWDEAVDLLDRTSVVRLRAAFRSLTGHA